MNIVTFLRCNLDTYNITFIGDMIICDKPDNISSDVTVESGGALHYIKTNMFIIYSNRKLIATKVHCNNNLLDYLQNSYIDDELYEYIKLRAV